jgi:hypothetical protein
VVVVVAGVAEVAVLRMALWGSCWGWFAREFVGLALVEVLGRGRGRPGSGVVGQGDDRARAAE